MQTIQSILNNLTSKQILQTLKEKNTKALFVGSKNPNDEVLETKLKDSKLTLEQIKGNAFIQTDVRRAYFDDNNCLCFEVNLDYDIASENTIYALAIVSEESIFVLALTPKIKKMQGIGGTFVLKTSIEGRSGEMVFKADDYISEAEFEPFRDFVDKFEDLLEDFKYKAKLKMLLLDLENYLDTQIQAIKSNMDKLNDIGRKNYFYRNSLPCDYVGMGERLSRDEYPLLWYFTLGCVGNDGREYFSIPKGGLYSKGTLDLNLVGRFEESGLPDIRGDIQGGNDSLTGNGVFFNNGSTGWQWKGGTDGWKNNQVGFKASMSNPIYGRSDDVEVNHISYLEGIYAGERIKSFPLDLKNLIGVKNG
ncbi:hypothetical protein [Helicobacter sp. 13S00477-4]|uniref:hypothetical protein n=1 Tax=Helicobacter sp. 13S00477-4 TaxID=1905759 RepID=UPI000BA548E5|nr:hypothetical protein [Helicobacter sp. 13S00477-4]PAF50851.1 hypothetical protein BKH44_06800 [Helicobacter sp. 13S00477-4]